MLKVVLESIGFITNYYSSPIIALDEFKSNFFDIIILEIQMSEINGMQLYREIRKEVSRQKYVF
jgi:DNA-binding response OmpR family regulator